MNPPSLRNRIRNSSLAMLVVALVLGGLALHEVHQLGGVISETLHRNYISIDAAQCMHATLWHLEPAIRDGDTSAVLPTSRDEFMSYIYKEEHNITEPGEAQLTADISGRGQRLFAELSASPLGKAPGQEFSELHQLLDNLIALNRDAMFRADGRASKMGDRLTYELPARCFYCWGLAR